MPYYGVIEDIWELDYSEFRVSVFKCCGLMEIAEYVKTKLDLLRFTFKRLLTTTTHSSW